MKNGWSRPFEDPIVLLDGRELVTLKNAADYIMKLPKAEQKHEKWQVGGADHGSRGPWPVDACGSEYFRR
jgi:hypothetical protein